MLFSFLLGERREIYILNVFRCATKGGEGGVKSCSFVLGTISPQKYALYFLYTVSHLTPVCDKYTIVSICEYHFQKD